MFGPRKDMFNGCLVGLICLQIPRGRDIGFALHISKEYNWTRSTVVMPLFFEQRKQVRLSKDKDVGEGPWEEQE